MDRAAVFPDVHDGGKVFEAGTTGCLTREVLARVMCGLTQGVRNDGQGFVLSQFVREAGVYSCEQFRLDGAAFQMRDHACSSFAECDIFSIIGGMKGKRITSCLRALTVAVVLVCALSVPCLAQEEDVADRIQQRYENLQSFQADFVQILTNAASGEQDRRTGSILFKHPSLVRWFTSMPEKELLVVGPQFVWDYFPAEELAVKYRVDQVFNSKTMVKFLSGRANLKEDFVVEAQGEDNGWLKFKLIPFEPEPSLVLGYMWVEKDTNLLRQVLLVDFFGNGNQVSLANVELDIPVEDGQFQFTPPEGVDVEDNTQ